MSRLRVLTIAFVAMTAVAFTGCSKDDDNKPAPALDVDKTTVDVTAAGGAASVVLTANVEWTATSDQTWCTINPASGKADQSLSITVAANDTWNARTATITVKAGELSEIVTLTQAAPEGFLIGGVTWALTNLQGGTAAHGATFAATPADFGSYYQGNRPKGWSADNLTGWDASDPGDTWEEANSPCPTGWRVPTQAEYEALLASHVYVQKDAKGNPVKGWFYGAKAADATWDNPQGCIFLPSGAGYIAGAGAAVADDEFYWTSTSKTFISGNGFATSSYAAGLLVRCVK